MVKKMEDKQVLVIDDYCEHRIKPKLIRDVKTEAILVFARTALERFFKKFDKEDTELVLENEECTDYVYGSLRNLLKDLQKHVVNVDYLIELIQNAKKYPQSIELRRVAKYEEPLIVYYDAMAKRMEYHFPEKITAVPEFIVMCVLCIWFIEEEKTSSMYPFLEKYDILEIIDRFEKYARNSPDDKKKLFSQMQKVSIDVVEVLKNVKYKFNPDRKSKIRKNR